MLGTVDSSVPRLLPQHNTGGWEEGTVTFPCQCGQFQGADRLAIVAKFQGADRLAIVAKFQGADLLAIMVKS